MNGAEAVAQAVAIVRKLGTMNAPRDSEWDYCSLCSGDSVRDDNDPSGYVVIHSPTCLWQRAVEWVEQHPAP